MGSQAENDGKILKSKWNFVHLIDNAYFFRLLMILVPFNLWAIDIKKIDRSSYMTAIKNRHSFNQPFSNLTDKEMDVFFLGRSFFAIPWVQAPASTTARDGLGPLFNANSCISCHKGNGGGFVYTKKGDISRSLIFKLSKSRRHGRHHLWASDTNQRHTKSPF